MPTLRTRKLFMPNGYLGRLFKVAALWLVLLAWVPAVQAADKVILTVGDSLTAGYGLAEADAFVARLQAALRTEGRDVTVKNGSVSGDTTAGGRARLGWALGGQVDAVILELGANDGLRGVDPAETRRNLDAILTELAKRGIPVLLTGMLAPPNLGPDYAQAYNSIYPDLARKHGVALYPFFLDGVVAQPTLNQGDGIHPNAAGMKVIVDGITPYVLDLLDRMTGG